jgi:hypothetical protein
MDWRDLGNSAGAHVAIILMFVALIAFAIVWSGADQWGVFR